jgi:hypothetical protein
MKMKLIYTVTVCILMTGCSIAKLEKEMTEQRKYSPSEMSAIRAQGQKYGERFTPNLFQEVSRDEFERGFADMKVIFCKCHKSIGIKCRESSESLTAEQKNLWIKANAAEFAIARIQDLNQDQKVSEIDPDTCQ